MEISSGRGATQKLRLHWVCSEDWNAQSLTPGIPGSITPPTLEQRIPVPPLRHIQECFVAPDDAHLKISVTSGPGRRQDLRENGLGNLPLHVGKPVIPARVTIDQTLMVDAILCRSSRPEDFWKQIVSPCHYS
jgi:hypothetical protein